MQPSNYVHATLLQGTAALNCKSGVIGGGAGIARDTEWLGAYIDLRAGAGATLTVTGFSDNTGAAASMILNGQITVDLNNFFPWPLLNEFAAYTFQPSVAGVIWVFTRSYTGP